MDRFDIILGKEPKVSGYTSPEVPKKQEADPYKGYVGVSGYRGVSGFSGFSGVSGLMGRRIAPPGRVSNNAIMTCDRATLTAIAKMRGITQGIMESTEDFRERIMNSVSGD